MIANHASRIAVLVDGENIPAACIGALQLALKKFGPAAVFRVFGDFTNDAHRDWLEVCRDHGLEAVLHMPVKAGKNGTDMVLAISAMDVMASGRIGTVVIVSDDSDFLPLARRLQAGGLTVIGMGMKKAALPSSTGFSLRVQIKSGPLPDAKPPEQVASIKPLQPPKQVFPPVKFRKVLLAILSEGALTLSALGKKLHDAYPEIASAVGNNKLKSRIENDSTFTISNDLVSRRAG